MGNNYEKALLPLDTAKKTFFYGLCRMDPVREPYKQKSSLYCVEGRKWRPCFAFAFSISRCQSN